MFINGCKNTIIWGKQNSSIFVGFEHAPAFNCYFWRFNVSYILYIPLMKLFLYKLFFIIFALFPLMMYSQHFENSTPWSFTSLDPEKGVQQISLLPPDAEILLKEDDLQDDFFRPERFAVMVNVGVNPLSSGSLEILENGNKVWRLKLSLQGSLASSLYFKAFKLPDEVKLFLYNNELKEVKGAYTKLNNRESGLFATPLIYSDEVTLELNIPSHLELDNWFAVAEMTYSYAGISIPGQAKGFGTSDFCEVNINCSPEGDDWQDEKRGVVKIQVKVDGFGYWCTGTMINNARNDNTPYLLTADHCAYKFGSYASTQDLGNWIFYFNYESSECENPAIEPTIFSLTGCDKIAHGGFRGLTGSDFYLVKLKDDIPEDWNVYFNGWSAEGEVSSEGVTIHHPDGDIKKISTYTDDLTSTSWQNSGLQSHWTVWWVSTENNWGVTEGGSSGAPLYDPQGRIIGTLTGGLASCFNDDKWDKYGKFSYHWSSNGDVDSTQLKPWLDPDDTGILAIKGATMGLSPFRVASSNTMTLFPNPVVDELTIKFKGEVNRDFTIKIFDVMGALKYSVFEHHVRGEYTLNVNHLNPGLYFLKKSGEEKEEIIKFVKR